MSTTSKCRMYKSRFPKVDMIVMVRVDEINDLSASVTLLEYGEIRGTMYKLINAKVGEEVPAVVLVSIEESSIVQVTQKFISKADVLRCKKWYCMSQLVHLILADVAEERGTDLEHLYILVGWPLYERYGHAFEAFKLIINNPNSVLSSLTDEVREIGPDGQGSGTVVEYKSDLKSVLVKHIQSRMKLEIYAVVEMTCPELRGILHITEALKQATAAGNDCCPVKVSVFEVPMYQLTTRVLDETEGVIILEKAIELCKSMINQYNGTFDVHISPRVARSENTEKYLELMKM